MFISIFLNFLGVIFYFLQRLARRNNKKVKPTIEFWLKDNWIELVSVAIIDVILMIILLQPETSVGLDSLIQKYVPFIALQVSVKPAMSALIGLLFAKFVYEIVKKAKYGKK